MIGHRLPPSLVAPAKAGAGGFTLKMKPESLRTHLEYFESHSVFDNPSKVKYWTSGLHFQLYNLIKIQVLNNFRFAPHMFDSIA